MKPSLGRALLALALLALVALSVAACGDDSDDGEAEAASSAAPAATSAAAPASSAAAPADSAPASSEAPASEPVATEVAAETAAPAEEELVKVTIGGGADNPLEGGVLKFAASIAKDHGVDLEVKELADSVALNEAVDGGELDSHLAVHWPYLESILSERGWKLTTLVPVYVSKYALRSEKVKTIDELPDGAEIGLPDDPSNQALSLQILANAGLLTLKDGIEPTQATVNDVASSPKNIKLKPLVSAQIPRALEELDGAIVQASYYQAAGIEPEGALLNEPADESYAIIVTAKEGWESDPRLQKLAEVFKDPRVADFVDQEYGDIAYGIRH
jgi:D-methionine transport system substrate-binding protein